MTAPRLYPDLFGGETPIRSDDDLERRDQNAEPANASTADLHRGHLCTVCRFHYVTPTDGQDTCEACAGTI